MQVSTNPFVKFAKLLKYDFLACARTFLPLYGAFLALSFVAGFSVQDRHEFFNDENAFGEIMQAVYGVMFCIVIIGTVTTLIRRFRKSLLGSEGYLSLMLPVGISNHIWSKLVNSLVWCVVCIIVAFLSITILSWQTGSLTDLLDDLSYPIRHMMAENVLVSTMFAILLCLANGALLCFAVVAIGHLTQKFRKGLQIVAAIVFCSLQSNSFHWLYILTGLSNDFGGVLILSLLIGWGALYFGITYYVLSRRLNLE